MPIDQFGFLGKDIDAVRESIKSINKEYFQYLDKLNAFLQNIKYSFKVNENDIQKIIVVCLFLKAIETMQAMYILCSYALKADTNILARALYENIVKIKYCFISEEHSKKYLYSDLNKSIKLANVTKSHPYLLEKSGKTLESIDKRIKEIEAEIKELGSHKNVEGIETMAKAVGEEKLYNSFYRIVCDDVHSNPRVLDQYFSAEKEPKFLWGPKDKDVKIPLLTAAEFILKIAPKYIDLFDLKAKKNEMNQLINEYNSLSNKTVN